MTDNLNILNNIVNPIDALEFVNNSVGGWDTIIMDSPYINPGDKRYDGKEKTYSGLGKRLHEGKNSLIMDPVKRMLILDVIKSKMAENYQIIYFHIDRMDLDYNYVWYKNSYSISNNESFNNHEFVSIETNCKLPWMQYILDYPTDSGSFKVPNAYIWKTTPRLAAKPLNLFKRLYKHCKSKYILDPFAGYGMSIKAALDLGLRIDACDIDPTVNYNFERPDALEMFMPKN